jgi:hypothetical protein
LSNKQEKKFRRIHRKQLNSLAENDFLIYNKMMVKKIKKWKRISLIELILILLGIIIFILNLR